LRKTQPKILVVDSDRDTLAALRISLGGEGYRLVVSSSPSEAFRHLESEKYELIITEVRLYGFLEIGLEFLTKLRHRMPNLPVIVIGSPLDPQIEKRLRDLQIHHYFTKPFELQSLKKNLRSLLLGSPKDLTSAVYQTLFTREEET